jgi:hypothetical protein
MKGDKGVSLFSFIFTRFSSFCCFFVLFFGTVSGVSFSLFSFPFFLFYFCSFILLFFFSSFPLLRLLNDCVIEWELLFFCLYFSILKGKEKETKGLKGKSR